MFIDEELEGYILKCKISEDFKNRPGYSDEEFYVTVYKDESSDSGYYALLENNEEKVVWDGEVVANNIFNKLWIVVNKVKTG
ncbi:TPA: hypothetical protein KQG29_000163 [Clostridioides difficile]|nr:hypothetical protein [Clostridioides difficile]